MATQQSAASASDAGPGRDGFGADISAVDYAKFAAFLEEVCGITLGENKLYLVRSRLAGVMQDCAVRTLGELVDKVEKLGSARLKAQVIDAMTTNETFWFRDGKPFEFLEHLVLPEFAKRAPSAPLRAWSAACSTGQEPYSIAMVCKSFQARNPGRLPQGLEILGTDISLTVLAKACAAEYDQLSVSRGLSDDRLERFFEPCENGFKVKDAVRRHVRFQPFNLLGDYRPLGRFDVIFMRNVLIYFSHENKRQILQRSRQLLNPGGYLLLGGSEPITNYSDQFEMIRSRYGVAYRVPA
jgi:chemotaxis protein methyltransferase CheR